MADVDLKKVDELFNPPKREPRAPREGDERRLQMLEELDRRGSLPANVSAGVRELRDRGAFKSLRNKQELSTEGVIRSIKNVKSMSETEARGLANYWVQLRYGERDDPTGRKRYGNDLTGWDYLARIKSEIDQKKYDDEFPDELDTYDAMNEQQKLAYSQEKLKEKTDTLAQRAGRGLRPQAIKQLKIAASQGSAEFGELQTTQLGQFTEDERISLQDPEALSAEERKTLLAKGRSIAFQKSYVPVRQFLEDRIGRDKTALAVAKEASATGKIDENQYRLLTPELQSFVSQYVAHTRPFDTEEGVMGALTQGAREFIVGSLSQGVKAFNFARHAGATGTAGWWQAFDPVAAKGWKEAYEQEREMHQRAGSAFDFKDAERNRLGKAWVGLNETMPFMMSVMLGGYTGGASTILAAGNVAEDTRVDMLNRDFTEEEAIFGGAATGAIAIYVERISGIAGKGKFADAMSKQLIAKTASKSIIKRLANSGARFTERWARAYTGEQMEEIIEGFAQPIVEDLVRILPPDLGKAFKASIDAGEQSSDVVALMTAFGGLAGTVSTSSSDVEINLRSINKIAESAAKRATGENFQEYADGVNEFILNTWTSTENKEQARQTLKDNNIFVDDQMAAELNEFEQGLTASEAITQEEVAAQLEAIDAESTTRAEAAEAKAEMLRGLGFRAEAVDILSGKGGLDESNAGQFKEDGGIEISKQAFDPEGVGDHEAMHGAVAFKVVTQGEIDILTRSNNQEILDGIAKAYAKDIASGDVAGMNEEAFSERYKDWKKLSKEEQTVMRKLMDFFTRLVNYVRSGEFKTVEDIFESIEPRLKERLAESSFTDTEAGWQAQDEAEIGSFEKRAAQQAPRMAKESRSVGDIAQLAAQTLRGAKMNAEGVQALADRYGVEVDAEAIVAEAKELQQIAQAEFDAKADAVLTAAQAKKASVVRKARAGMKQIRRQGFIEGEQKQKVKARLEKQARAKKLKEQIALDADQLSTQEERLRKNGVPISGVNTKTLREAGVISEDADAMFDGTQRVVDELIGDEDITNSVRMATIRGSLAKAMRALMSASVPQKHRSDLSKRIAEFSAMRKRDGISKVRSSYDSVMKELNAKREKAHVQNIRADFKKLVKRLLTKKNKKAHEELGRKTVTPLELAMVQAFGKLAESSKETVSKIFDTAQELFDLDEMAGDKSAEVLRESLLKDLPWLKDLDLSDSALGQIGVQAALGYGNIEGMNQAGAQDALDSLTDFIASAKSNLASQIEQRNKVLQSIKDRLLDALNFNIEKFGRGQGNFVAFDMLDPFSIVDEIFINLPDGHPAKGLSFELRRELNGARRNTHAELEAFNKELKTEMQRIYSDKELRAIAKTHEEWSKYDINGAPISKRSLMLTILNLRQPDVQERAKDKNGVLRKDSELAKQVAQLDELEALMDTKDNEFMDWMVKRIDKEYSRASKVYKDLTGKALPKVELYFPLSQFSEVKSGYNGQYGGGASIIKGFLKQRVQSTKRITTDGDVVGRIGSHMEDVFRFVHYTVPQTKLRDTLFSKKVKAALIEAWGARNYEIMRSSLVTEFLGRPEKRGPESPAIKKAMSAMIHMALDGNILSAGRQIVDVLSVSAKLGSNFTNYLLNPAEIAQSIATTKELFDKNSKHRLKLEAMISEGGAPQFHTQMRGFLQLLGRSKGAEIARTLIGVVPAADKISRLMAIGPAYRAAMDTPQIKAIEDADAREVAALDEAILALEQTLQSPQIADRPLASREGGTLSKMATVFTSALTPKIGQTVQAMRQLKKGGIKNKAAYKALANKLLYYHILGGTFQFSVAFLAGLLFDDDDEWWDKKDTAHLMLNIATGPFAGAFAFGPIADAATRGLLGLPTYQQSPLGLLGSSVKDAAITTRLLGEGFSDGDYSKAQKKAFDTFMKMSAPGRLTKKAMKKYID